MTTQAQKIQQLRQQSQEFLELTQSLGLLGHSMYDGLVALAQAKVWKTKDTEQPVEIICGYDLVNLFQSTTNYSDDYPFVERFNDARILVGEQLICGNVVAIMYLQNGHQEVDLTVNVYNSHTLSFSGRVEKFTLVVNRNPAIL